MKRATYSPRKILRLSLIIVLTIAIIFSLYYFGIIKKNCKEEEACFDQRLKECKPTNYDAVINNNHYKYTIKGEKQDFCRVKIKLIKMAIGTPKDQITLFEGKSMDCSIPEESLNIEIEKLDNLLKDCSGPLKESIYEQMITKMYGLVLKNMDEIMEELNSQI